MISATDAFPDTTPADQRHTQTVIGDHFSDIDEDEQGGETTSQSLDVGVGDEAQPRTSGMSVTRDMGDDTGAHGTADVAAPVVDTDVTLSATDPPRDPQSSRTLLVSPPPDDAPSRGRPAYTDGRIRRHRRGRSSPP